MDWSIVYPRKIISFKTREAREREVVTGSDLDELLDLVKDAYENSEEIEISLSEHDPTPFYLYDNSGGEAPVSSDERWQQAFDQKRELHS